MRIRSVTQKQVINCIEKPDVFEKQEDVYVAKKLQKDKKLLMVVYDKKIGRIISVITVIKTSKIHKYL